MQEIKIYSPSFCITHRCNLNCIYCYQKHDTQCMSFETAKKVISKIFENTPETCKEVHIGFIGGEPLLEFDLIRRICEYTWQNGNIEKQYIFFATTNGTILTEESKKWFISNLNRFKLALSLDGCRESHNINRSNSFDKIDLDFFQKYYKDQGVKMTISEYSLNNFAENVKYIHSLGFDIHGSNLAEGNFDWSNENNLRIIAEQLKSLIKFYLENPNIKVCQMLDKNLANCERKETTASKHCGIGYGANFYDIDGKEYPCTYCTPMTFTKDQLETISNFDFRNEKNFTDIDCLKNCYLYPTCPSCAGNNYKQTGHFNIHERSKCKITKLTALFIAELQAQKIIQNEIEMDDNQKFWTIEAIKKIKEKFCDEFKEFLS